MSLIDRISRWARLPSARQLQDMNARLRREAEAHEVTLRELEVARRELETRVDERTKELSLVTARFETALHGANIYVFTQDRDLRYTWISAQGDAAKAMIGRTDSELKMPSAQDSATAAKRRVLQTGEPADCEITSVLPGRHGLFALHIDPSFGPDGKIDGIIGAAIDIGGIRSLESEQRRLTAELASALQLYETALRGSNITVFTQDLDLRYTSVSRPMFGLKIEEIVGRLDDDVLPADSRDPIIKLKRQVLDGGNPKDGEVRIHVDHNPRWYDLHIEPLRDVAGDMVGITCAAVEVTARKNGEAHLRELLREITHRSKNLLAVIQSMARQTARHSSTTESFLEEFGARLQALSASHDLLVQEGWHGASLYELVRSQLGHYINGGPARVHMNGPAILLTPEAAQSLGLALHELAANAGKYGALSVADGRVTIDWQSINGAGIEIVWSERGGPPVAKPEHHGFGTLVIERNLQRALEAEVAMDFAPQGLVCRMKIPPANLVRGR
jgi:PAS domain S-box-containing protein